MEKPVLARNIYLFIFCCAREIIFRRSTRIIGSKETRQTFWKRTRWINVLVGYISIFWNCRTKPRCLLSNSQTIYTISIIIFVVVLLNSCAVWNDDETRQIWNYSHWIWSAVGMKLTMRGVCLMCNKEKKVCVRVFVDQRSAS